jgi:hypothetical protein
MTYIIKDWVSHYEKADTRKCKEMKWVAIPTDTADKKYRRITKMEGGAELFGIWISIIEVASKMPVRGTLSDDDGDLSCEDMELIGGFPAKSYEKALIKLASPEIGWITDTEGSNLTENAISGNHQDSVPTKQEVVLTTGQDRTRQDKTRQTTYPDDSVEMRLANLMVMGIVELNPSFKRPNMQSWAKEFNLIIRIDKRELEELKFLMGWINRNSFWSKNILSPASLRKQFDRLTMETKNEPARPKTVIQNQYSSVGN